MTHSKKKKKNKGRAPRQGNGNVNGNEGGEKVNEERRILDCLAEAFSSVSLEGVTWAYGEAEGDTNKAAEILGVLSESGNEPSTSSSCSERFFDSNGDEPSTSSSSSSSERFFTSDVTQVLGYAKGFGGNKQKRVVASAGTVSRDLGKDYVRSNSSDRSRGYNLPKCRGLSNKPASNEEAEQFLCSMLGDECEISMAVVRDVYSNCGYDVEKALDALFDLSASYGPLKDGGSCNHSKNCKQDSKIFVECSGNIDGTVGKCQLTGRMSDSTSYLSEELQQTLLSSDYDCRNYLDVLVGSKKHSPSWPATTEPDLPQKVLESLFNVSKSSEHESNNNNWKNVVKKMESFAKGLDIRPASDKEVQQNTDYAIGEEYQVFRRTAGQHWDTMKSYYQKAATAYSRGERGYAAYLSEEGKAHNKIAQEADEKASQEIFEARNKGIQNVVTIDLHGQHEKQAIRLLKVHLVLFTNYIPSVRLLKVITGCGTHGVGKGKLKQSVISLVKKAGIEWSEENRGTLLLKLDRRRELSFTDSDGEPD